MTRPISGSTPPEPALKPAGPDPGEKIRQNGRVVSVAVIVAVGVDGDDRREVLGMAIGHLEAEAFWTTFPRKLGQRGLRGVQLAICDDQEGLEAAVAKLLHASPQRCLVHFARNPWLAPARTAGAWSRPSSPPRSPRTMPRPAGASGVRSPTSFARRCERHSVDPQSPNGEIERGIDVPGSGPADPWTGAGVFPDEAAIARLVGALLLEQPEERAVRRNRSTTLETIPPDDKVLTTGAQVGRSHAPAPGQPRAR